MHIACLQHVSPLSAIPVGIQATQFLQSSVDLTALAMALYKHAQQDINMAESYVLGDKVMSLRLQSFHVVLSMVQCYTATLLSGSVQPMKYHYLWLTMQQLHLRLSISQGSAIKQRPQPFVKSMHSDQGVEVGAVDSVHREV